MPKKFAVFDIDGTLIRWQLFHAIVHHLGKHNYIDAETHDAIRAARMKWKNRSNTNSFKDYESLLVRAYIASLKEINPRAYELIVDEVFNEYKDQLFVYTRELLKKLKSEGYLLFAISGSQDEIVQKLATYHGFDAAIGAILEIHDGKYTGQITTPIHNKDEVLATLVKKYNATYSDSVAVGDSSGDISMLSAVENPIAFNPEAALFTHAKEKGWTIAVERKNVTYQLVQNKGTYELRNPEK
jgi:HAD superfamily hydrolase (TIGR01490 family)